MRLLFARLPDLVSGKHSVSVLGGTVLTSSCFLLSQSVVGRTQGANFPDVDADQASNKMR